MIKHSALVSGIARFDYLGAHALWCLYVFHCADPGCTNGFC